MRVHVFAAFALTIVLASTSAATAQTTTPSADLPAEGLTHLHLESLDAYRVQLTDFEDNAFQLQERTTKYMQAVNQLPGAKLEWVASVAKVTPTSVHLYHAQFGRTRIVLVHYTEQGNPAYGTLEYSPPRYAVPPTTYRYARHAGESTLEIGLEIPLALAKTLRRGDQVQLSGHIEDVESRLKMGNSPDTLLYLANIQARKYLTPEELDALSDAEAAAR
ncbi:MAG: hypothetical protein KDB14_12640 [Planctomycetales bacterium]|nr:hypothetical protein [Planctomycetales bacterium]